MGTRNFKYLGTTIGASPLAISYWQPMIDIIKRKIQYFRANGISMAGKTPILKSVVESMPVYWFNLYRITVTVIKEIEKIRRQFLWDVVHSNGVIDNKLHLLKRGSVCQPKNKGGLGLVPLRIKKLGIAYKVVG